MTFSNLPKQTIDIWLLSAERPLNISTVELGRCEKIRSSSYVHLEDKQRYQNIHIKLRLLLAAYLEISPAAVIYRYGKYGKPDIDYVALSSQSPAIQDLKFNISHADSHSIVAVMREAELGVDVERMRELADARQLLASISHQGEFQLASAANQYEQCFLNTWICKEALLKALAVGLTLDMNSFAIVAGDDAHRCRFSSPYQDWYAHMFQPQHDLYACVVTNAAYVDLKHHNFDRDFQID